MMDWLKEFDVLDFGYTENSKPFSWNHFHRWVDDKKHIPLEYLADDRKIKRENLKNFYPPFQSALVFLFSYHSTHQDLEHLYLNNPNWNGLKLASYTLGFSGEDYHFLIKDKLEEIGKKLSNMYGLNYQVCLDTHPVLERDLALRAGMGWFGKNSMLIHKSHGSFFLIGSLLLDKKLDLETSRQDVDHCGQCTLCVDACPTKAIDPSTRTIIAKDCISTFTIEEFKLESTPSEKMNLNSGFIFGCDICQDVCPWNKRVDRMSADRSPEFNLKQKNILDFFLLRPVTDLHQEMESLSGGRFERIFKRTSFSRSGKRGLLKNIRFYLKNKLDIFS